MFSNKSLNKSLLYFKVRFNRGPKKLVASIVSTSEIEVAWANHYMGE